MSLTQEEQTQLEILVSFIEEGSGGPTPPEAIDRAEVALGRPLPLQLRTWLESVDGAILAEGNLHISPLWGTGEADDGVTALATQTAALGLSGWELPEELVIFATDGSDQRFGLWLPKEGDDPHVVVALDLEPGPGERSFWIVGESFLSFLVGWSAAFAHLHHGAVYELLQVPAELQRPVQDSVQVDETGRAVTIEDEVLFTRVLQFASPTLPAVVWPGDEDHALTADELRRSIAELPRRHETLPA